MADFLPFENAHIESAALLVADRYMKHREVFPMLPQEYTMVDHTRTLIRKEFDRPFSMGYAAVENDHVVSFMLGYELQSGLYSRSGWVQLAGHGGSLDHYPQLYALLADEWVRDGCFAHAVMVPAPDRDMLNLWFDLGFGKEQAYAIRSLEAVQLTDSIEIDVRRATAADEAIARAISDTVAGYQTGSPVFGPTTRHDLADLADSYAEVMTDDDYTFWLGIKDGEVIAYHIYEASNPSLISPEHSVELPSAGTLTTQRGQGIGTQMCQYCFSWAKEQGFDYVVADWRTTNLLASNFWRKVGFEPVAYRLARRIDPNIAWGRIR